MVKYKFEILDNNNKSLEPNEFGETGVSVTKSREMAFEIINNLLYGWCYNVKITISVNNVIKNTIITDNYEQAELFLTENYYV